tara:strand:+ start:296 stop:1120 length:825 start_codon:yes stop_codon:yes gene_type:complete
MKIIIDIREQGLYDQCWSILCSQPTPTTIQLEKDTLELGDIAVKTDDDIDVLLIERKTFSDLISSIKDGRYEEQSFRLLNGTNYPPHSIFYLLEGRYSDIKNPIEKKTVFSAMTSLQFFKGFSIQRTSTIRETAEWILYISEKIERDFSKGKVPYYLTKPFQKIFKKNDTENDNEPEKIENTNDVNYVNVIKKCKKDNITTNNFGQIILCQIPGISSTTAIAIMNGFNDFSSFYEELKNNPDLLQNIQYESKGKPRKLNKTCIENINKFLLNNM